MPTIPDLETQAKDFANKITNIVQCFDDNAKAFKVDILGKEKTHSATVEIYNDDGFSLYTNEKPNFHIEAQWTCRYDAYGYGSKDPDSKYLMESIKNVLSSDTNTIPPTAKTSPVRISIFMEIILT